MILINLQSEISYIIILHSKETSVLDGNIGNGFNIISMEKVIGVRNESLQLLYNSSIILLVEMFTVLVDAHCNWIFWPVINLPAKNWTQGAEDFSELPPFLDESVLFINLD